MTEMNKIILKKLLWVTNSEQFFEDDKLYSKNFTSSLSVKLQPIVGLIISSESKKE